MPNPENLDELFTRKSRRLTGAWTSAYTQDGTTHVYAQPMTLAYVPYTQDGVTPLTTLDGLTGEVWKLSDTPNLATIYHKDIAFSHWSADGRRLALFAYTWSPAPYTAPQLSTAGNLCILTCETTGRYLRPPIEGPNRKGGGYFHWCPQTPDTWYDVGSAFLDPLALGLSNTTLYKGTVSDTGGSSTSVVAGLAQPVMSLGKLISADGRRAICRNYTSDATQIETFQPVTILPTPSKDTTADITIDRTLATYGQSGWPIHQSHDAYYPGIGDWWFLLTSEPSKGVWWRLKRTGSAADGGALYTGPSNCVHYLSTSGTVSGGAFRLTFQGQQTGYIAWNAIYYSASDTGTGTLGNPYQSVQAAVAALSNVGAGNVGCWATSATLGSILSIGTISVIFCGSLAGTDFAAMTVDNASITGGGTVVCTKGRTGAGAAAFTEAIPINHGGFPTNGLTNGGELRSPYVNSDPGTYTATSSLCTYWSHPGQDRWDRMTAFGMVATGYLVGGVSTFGQAIWDHVNSNQVTPLIYAAGASCQHNDWSGFSDVVVCNYGPDGSPQTYITDRIMAASYDGSTLPQKVLCYTNGYYNTPTRQYQGDYNAHARPFLSPDGTKVAFHSTFLNGLQPGALIGTDGNPTDSAVDVFWCVARYPIAPTDLAATATSGTVTVSWLPATYTARRWLKTDGTAIDEAAGEMLYAREVKTYHLWRAPDAAGSPGAWAEVASTPAYYGNDGTTNTLKPRVSNGGAFVGGANRIALTDVPGDGTWHYAITAEEWSGLESRKLGVSLKTTVSGGSVTGTQIVTINQAGFWTTAPSAPTSFSAAATGTGGLNSLSWTEPVGTKVRHYNLYYSTSSSPTATQARRIASLPAGTAAYKDWLANPAASVHYYSITSVDRQGNESVRATAQIGGAATVFALTAGGLYYVLSH